jgi:HSP20 family protein
MECNCGSFHRVIPLPTEIDQDKADAYFEKGVLKIRLPKSPEARKKPK